VRQDASACVQGAGGPLSRKSEHWSWVLDERPLKLTEFDQLTHRERAVVRQAVVGLPLKVIAGNLSISLQAVSTYLGRASRKLAVRSRGELAARVSGRKPSFTGLEWTSPAQRLTAAELAIGALIFEGRSNASIARSRRTSLRTAENQIAGLLRKLGVTTRNELIALSIPARTL
jgi:DNA-binding CsgD family transcriptional regulator